jgi:glutamate dehydrogenase
VVAADLDRFLTSEEGTALTLAAERLRQNNVPEHLAKRLVGFEPLYSALDIVEIAIETKRSVEEVAGVYFVVGGRLNFSWLRKQIDELPAGSHWQMLAKTGLTEDLSHLQTELTALILKFSPEEKVPDSLIQKWEAENKNKLERSGQLLADFQSVAKLDLSMVSVALRELRKLT